MTTLMNLPRTKHKLDRFATPEGALALWRDIICRSSGPPSAAWHVLKELLGEDPPGQRRYRALLLRYGANHSLSGVAYHLGVSRERARQIILEGARTIKRSGRTMDLFISALAQDMDDATRNEMWDRWSPRFDSYYWRVVQNAQDTVI